MASNECLLLLKKGEIMKKITELNLGSNDAEDYKRKEMKELFNDIFLRDHNLDHLLQSNVFFVIGEKGTGKTAYAVYLANNEYKNTRSQIKYIRETQYQKFVTLKKEKSLNLSDYSAIWRVIILVLIASSIKDDNIKDPFSKNTKYKAIQSAIDEYYIHAFSPEISNVLQIIDNTKETAELILKYLNIKDEKSSQITFNETRFQTNLNYIERNLIEALMDLKLKFNQYLFIDGIDIRPDGIEYKEYLSCVKGLAEAIWSLNNDQFSISNGSKGRMKAIILVRPDIFQAIGLQNSTNKIRNNSVFLDWRTTYPEHRSSNLFLLSDKLLSSQQNTDSNQNCWDYYFPWTIESTSQFRDSDTAFIQFLRLSYSRPRDIVTIVQILQDIQKRKLPDSSHFELNIFKSREFNEAYSEYLMGGIKDQLSFYYSEENYQMLLHFLSYFKNNIEFSYDFFCEQYDKFVDYVLNKATELPEFIEEKELFLQFLYESNIICYIEHNGSEALFRWCYRERNLSNMSPKVQLHKRYKFHLGLIKALNL